MFKDAFAFCRVSFNFHTLFSGQVATTHGQTLTLIRLEHVNCRAVNLEFYGTDTINKIKVLLSGTQGFVDLFDTFIVVFPFMHVMNSEELQPHADYVYHGLRQSCLLGQHFFFDTDFSDIVKDAGIEDFPEVFIRKINVDEFRVVLRNLSGKGNRQMGYPLGMSCSKGSRASIASASALSSASIRTRMDSKL